MDAASSLHVPGSVEGQSAARAGFDTFLAAHGLGPGTTWRFQVALDEALSNIVKYARTAGGERAQVVNAPSTASNPVAYTIRSNA